MDLCCVFLLDERFTWDVIANVSWQCSVVETADMEGVCVLLEQIIVKRKQPFQIINEAQLL